MQTNTHNFESATRPISRRRFVKTAVAGTALTTSAFAILHRRNPNERLNIAVIGCGGRGQANLRMVSGENIVALCDVSEENLGRAASSYPRARQFVDFRRMYDYAHEFDAVVVSTTEHTHAFATLPALQLGKHVFCEKPLTHNIWEARVIREAASHANVATQMGIKIHAMSNYRRVVELVESGAIGAVREVHVWVSRAWGWHPTRASAEHHGDKVFVQKRSPKPHPVPVGMNWDLWLGPAPQRPFHSTYIPGPKWYRWWDFGNGTMSDLGSHWIDLPFWALKLDHPRTVTANGPAVNPEIAPASMMATFEYGVRGALPPVRLSWYQGSYKPAIWHTGRVPQWENGALFVGDEGLLLSDYKRHVLLPETQYADYRRPDAYIPESPGLHAEWIDAAKTGAPTTCDFQYSGLLTEANHLGNVAYRLGRKIEWDFDGLRVKNVPEADALIRREYRKGWDLA